jgi:diguanylate cyclase (GGDEF)-like protein/PAS domain S-box-containing protein
MASLLPLLLRRAAPTVELSLDGLAAFPGAVAVVSEAGLAESVTGGAASLIPLLQNAGTWPAVVDAALRTIRGGTAAVEVVEPPGAGGPIEVTLLPLAQGRRALAMFRTVGLEQVLRRRLVESRQRYKDLVEAAADFAWETDAEGRFSFVSPGGVLDWSPHELTGRRPEEFLVEASAEDVAGLFAARRPARDLELRMRRADGGEEWLSLCAMPVLDEEGIWRGARGLGRRTTEDHLRRHEAARGFLHDRLAAHLARSTSLEADPAEAMRAALAATGLAVAAAGGIVLRAAGGEAIRAAQWGSASDEAFVEAARRLVLGRGEGEVPRPGTRLLTATTRFDGAVNGLVALWRDEAHGPFGAEDGSALAMTASLLGSVIAQQERLERAMALSRTDPLTGLLNRRGFAEEAARRVARMAHAPATACLAYIDLDNFKLVNDTRGHEAGDAALLALKQVLHDHSRSGDLIARLGGDEFAMWLDGVDAPAASVRAEAILEATRRLGSLTGDPERPLGVSIGLVIYRSEKPDTVEALLARADAAMYEVKRNGKGRVLLVENEGQGEPR